MLDEDDATPRKAGAKVRDLRRLSIDELKGYVADLEAEIVRVRAEIGTRQDVRGAAEALFKPRPVPERD